MKMAQKFSLPNEKARNILETKGPDALQEYLSENPMSQNERDEALKWICLSGNVKGVEIILQHGANANYEDAFGGTPLQFAMRGENSNVVLILLPHLQDAGLLKQELASTILHWACEKDSVELVRFLAEEMSLPVHDIEVTGRAAIHTACLFGGQKVVDYLVSQGLCDVNVTDKNGWTPLHYSCSSSSDTNNGKVIISYLIASQADPMLKTPEGKTALHIAFEHGRESVLIKALKTHTLICMICTVDDIVPARASKGSIHQHKDTPGSPTSKDETATMIMRAWRKIFMNDDVDMLLLLRDSEIWQSGACNTTFETSQAFDEQKLSDLFNDCYENGIGVYTYMESTFGYNITEGRLKEVLIELTGLSCFDPILKDGEEIFSSPHLSIAVLALLCGRLQVAEMLLRMRQFDIIPAALFMSLIARQLAEEASFSEQVKDTLTGFAGTTESIAVDSLGHVFLRDNTSGKHVCFENLDIPLPPYGNISLIDLADKANCTNFLSLPCSQVVLDKRWNGKLTEIPTFWRFFLKLCPPLLLIYIRLNIKKDEEKRDKKRKTRRQSVEVSGHVGNYNIHNDIKILRKDNSCFQQLRFIRQIYLIPATKYFVHSLLHLLFLALFSYVVLYDFYFNPTIPEILCASFVLGYAVEEIRQIIFYARKGSLKSYITDVWNWIDLSATIITITGFCIRCARIGYVTGTPMTANLEAHETVLYWSRVLLITGLVLFYIRILNILSISSILGPKLNMIGNMFLKDMFPLLIIFTIFVVAFGVAFQGLLYPNGYPIDSTRVSGQGTSGNLFRRAFYGMFGTDYPLEELDCESGKSCPSKMGATLVKYVYQVFYVLIVNVMLINLLIALFSNTIALIDQRSMDHWLAERYKLVEEYIDRSILPSPLNLFCVLVEIIIFFVRCCRKKRDAYAPDGHNELGRAHTGSILRYIVIQSFALKGHRYHLGGANLSNSKDTVTSKRDDLLRKLEYNIQEMSEEMHEIASFIKLDRYDGDQSDIVSPMRTTRLGAMPSSQSGPAGNQIKKNRRSFEEQSDQRLDRLHSFLRRLDEETML